MKKAIEVMNELKKKKLIKDYAIGGAIAALRWVEPFYTGLRCIYNFRRTDK